MADGSDVCSELGESGRIAARQSVRSAAYVNFRTLGERNVGDPFDHM
jgi:hypothetical protein